MHLGKSPLRALQVWTGDIHLWAHRSVCVDLFLYVEVRVGLDASGCPYCCHACRQIQTGCGERYFRKMRYHLALGIQVERGGVEHMLVHSDETGKHRVTS